MSARPLNEPVAIPVRAHTTPAGTRPTRVFNARARRWTGVEHVLDAWVVDDRWWTSAPVRRAYFACQLVDGTAVTVFCDLDEERWYAQR